MPSWAISVYLCWCAVKALTIMTILELFSQSFWVGLKIPPPRPLAPTPPRPHPHNPPHPHPPPPTPHPKIHHPPPHHPPPHHPPHTPPPHHHHPPPPPHHHHPPPAHHRLPCFGASFGKSKILRAKWHAHSGRATYNWPHDLITQEPIWPLNSRDILLSNAFKDRRPLGLHGAFSL